MIFPYLSLNDVVVPTIRVLNGQEQSIETPIGIQQIDLGNISTDQVLIPQNLSGVTNIMPLVTARPPGLSAVRTSFGDVNGQEYVSHL